MLWRVEAGASERKTVHEKLHWVSSLTAAPPSYQTCFTPPCATLHFRDCTRSASKWLIFIQRFQVKYLSVDRIQNQKGQIYSQLVLSTEKTHTKETKKLRRPIMAVSAKVGIWKHKTHNAIPHHTRVTYPTWSCSSLKASLVLTQKLLSFASSKKRGSAKQALPPLVTHY